MSSLLDNVIESIGKPKKDTRAEDIIKQALGSTDEYIKRKSQRTLPSTSTPLSPTGANDFMPAQIAPVAEGEAQRLAQAIATGKFGWSGQEWDALYELVNNESGWNPHADNPTSSAAGLFQKMTNLHGPLEPTIEGQIMWGLNYIKDRYGSPSQALAHWRRRVPLNGRDVGNWY